MAPRYRMEGLEERQYEEASRQVLGSTRALWRCRRGLKGCKRRVGPPRGGRWIVKVLGRSDSQGFVGLLGTFDCARP